MYGHEGIKPKAKTKKDGQFSASNSPWGLCGCKATLKKMKEGQNPEQHISNLSSFSIHDAG